MAHNGVLFLDELPEFPRAGLELLRHPIEERQLTKERLRMKGRLWCASAPARLLGGSGGETSEPEHSKLE